jgi:hypothetical protein
MLRTFVVGIYEVGTQLQCGLSSTRSPRSSAWRACLLAVKNRTLQRGPLPTTHFEELKYSGGFGCRIGTTSAGAVE